MRNHLPWLGQGDIFSSVPVLDVTLSSSGAVQAEVAEGPAVLLSHDCDMDKPDRTTGQPRISRMQFARLRSVDATSPTFQTTLRASKNSVGPFEGYSRLPPKVQANNG
jgi:hypothetical protein